VGSQQVYKHLSGLVGKTLPVLVERNNRSRTEYFSEVLIDKDMPLGKIALVKMESIENDYIKGSVAA
jgi:hypothetical protein